MIEQIANILWIIIRILIVAYGLCYVVISIKNAKRRRNDTTSVEENMIARYKNK